MVRWLAASGAASLLDRGEQEWRAACPPHAARSGHPVALLIYAHRKIAALAEGEGWDDEYPRDTWHMPPAGHRLPVRHPAVRRHPPAVAERPGQAVDPVAAEHRPIRRRPATAASARSPGSRSSSPPRTSPGPADQPRRPRALPRRPGRRKGRAGSRPRPRRQAGTFLRDVRQHSWDTSLPAVRGASFPRTTPARGEPLPRALAGAHHDPGREPG